MQTDPLYCSTGMKARTSCLTEVQNSCKYAYFRMTKLDIGFVVYITDGEGQAERLLQDAESSRQ